jgi:excisionase family DNA binding protein
MNLLTAREAAEYLHVSLFTLARMEKEALLVPYRTPGGHRRYSLEMLEEYLERSRVASAKRRRRVLVVDDGKEVADLLAPSFPSCDFTTARDELDVGMKIAEFQPHLILVNTAMSGLDGLGLCRRVDGQGIELRVLAFAAPRAQADTGEEPELHQSDLAALEEGIERALRGL